MKSFYVYILKCNDGSYYVGHTDNIEKRISEHHLGMSDSKYVSKRLPAKVVFVEDFAIRDEAISAERQLKGWSRNKKEILVESGWESMKGFCKKQKMKKN